jgi:hypothetical protein
MIRLSVITIMLLCGGGFFFEPLFSQGAENPFLRPGGNKPAPPPVVRPAPPPPAPIPRNPNLEFRGYFKFENEWHFAIFDKAKNEGVWLRKGESFDDGKVEIVGFDEKKDEVRLKGGMSLALKTPDNRVMSVPSGQPSKTTKTGARPPSPAAKSIPPPRRR